MSTSNYIKKHYSILTYGLCILFVITLVVSVILTFDKKPSEISVGIIILLFSDVILAILSFVSMVAMFREVSRLHAHELPQDTIVKIKDDLIKIQDKIENKTEKIVEKPDKYTELEQRINDLERRLNKKPKSLICNRIRNIICKTFKCDDN